METDVKRVSEIEDLEIKLSSTKAQLRDLATMGAVITRIQEMDAVLSVVMDMAVRLVNGEVGIILKGAGEELIPVVSWGVSGDFIKALHYEDGIDIATYSYINRQSIVLSELQIHSEEGINIDSLISMPIQTRDKCLGVMVIINKSDGSPYSDEDKDILKMLLDFVAVAIDNSDLVKDRLASQKSEQEMAIAKQIQETILPRTDRKIKGAEIGAVYFPAQEVGGDFYEIITIDDDKFLAVLGDVSNKGVPAALIMSACTGIIKTIMSTEPSIAVNDLAVRVNNVLSEQIVKDRDMFVTLFFAKFDLGAMELTYCNGGHIPGLFWCNADHKIYELPDGGPIVGQFPRIPFKLGRRKLASGDRLFLFTDGLTEAEDAEGHLFGRERVEQVFSVEIGLSPKDFCLKVKEWVDRYNVGSAEESHDDFTILQVKVD